MNRILVVDNNPVVLEFMHEILTQAGYQVRTADSGLSALQIVEEYRPELIFVDLVMPEIDGRLLCRVLRHNPVTSNCPIVVVSAIAAEDSDTDFLQYVDAYLAKMPFAELGKHVLKVVSDLAAGNTAAYSNRSIGTDKLFSREITHELLDSRRHLEVFLENTPSGVLELTTSGTILLSNQPACEIIGALDLDLVSRNLIDFLPEAVGERIATRLAQSGDGVEEIGAMGDIVIRDQRIKWTLVPIRHGGRRSILVFLHNISNWYDSNHQIKTLLQDKEILLREVYHRVKNNLVTVSALLALNAQSSASPEAADALREAGSRVDSMLTIYDLLVQSEDYQEIDLAAFLETLTENLAATYADVRLVAQIETGNLVVASSVAIALGLAVNELVTNAVKHAFHLTDPADRLVQVGLTRGDHGLIRVSVSDNGKGVAQSTELRSSSGLGLQLVQATADQIGADITIEREHGTRVVFSFAVV